SGPDRRSLARAGLAGDLEAGGEDGGGDEDGGDGEHAVGGAGQKNGPGPAARTALTRPAPQCPVSLIGGTPIVPGRTPRKAGRRTPHLFRATQRSLPSKQRRPSGGRAARLPPPWRTSTSTRCRTSGGSTRPTRRC